MAVHSNEFLVTIEERVAVFAGIQLRSFSLRRHTQLLSQNSRREKSANNLNFSFFVDGGPTDDETRPSKVAR